MTDLIVYGWVCLRAAAISVHAALAVPPGITATTGVVADADVESFSERSDAPDRRRRFNERLWRAARGATLIPQFTWTMTQSQPSQELAAIIQRIGVLRRHPGVPGRRRDR
ncbi:hypothetical protein ACFWJ5_05280 [Streptomyces qaidamensis]|uniref:hypothetical protein n=1 Tax=Streptomyces qaidamensis TaxID=1783515 RepID=UPI00366A4B72